MYCKFGALKYFSFTSFSDYLEFASFTAICGQVSSFVLVRKVINKNGASIHFFLNNLNQMSLLHFSTVLQCIQCDAFCV